MTTITNCVLVSLVITTWDANVQDHKVSADVADANMVTDRKLCRLRKTLVPKNTELSSLMTASRAIRSFHYANTLAWMHEGPRILPTKNVGDYMKKMRELKAVFEERVQDFLEAYPSIRDSAINVLGTLYDPSNYPEVDSLRKKYTVEMKVMPMPDASGLLMLNLETEDAADFKAKLEADMAETFKAANRRMWEELFARLENLHHKLSDEKANVRKGTLIAVQELAALLPKMNITNDVRLDALAKSLQTSLSDLSEDAIKNDPSAREKATAATASVFGVMQAFMNPHRNAESMEFRDAA